MRVFIGATSLRPAYGGPAFSVSRLAIALAEAGADVGLWSSDQSAGDTHFAGLAHAVSRLIGNAAEALDRFGKPDILHDNGIWLRHNHQLAKLALQRGIPRIVSTRGMLEPWAMRHKSWKKTHCLAALSVPRSQARVVHPYDSSSGRHSMCEPLG